MPPREKFKTVDQYIGSLPSKAQAKLQEIRATLHQELPDAQEVISYNIGAFRQKKIIVFFAGFPDHVSVYPVPSGDAAFQGQVAKYRAGKGTLHFSLDEPLPLDFIRQVAHNLLKDRGQA